MTDFDMLCLGDLAFLESEVTPPELPDADFRTGNVEIVISDNLGEPAEKQVLLSAAPTSARAYRKSLRLDVVSVSNNHAMDYGATGLLQTMSALRAQGIECVGGGAGEQEARASVIVKRHGLRIGVVGVTCVLPVGFMAGPSRPGCWGLRVWQRQEFGRHEDQPGAAPFIWTEVARGDLDVLIDVLSTLRHQCDISVLHIHWGVPPPWLTPFHGLLATYQRSLVEQLGQARPTVIVGHHPHVLQGVEWVDQTLVLYSLGHFVFQPWGRLAARSPTELVGKKAAASRPGFLYPPYLQLEDERNWTGGLAMVSLAQDRRGIKPTRCALVPYRIDRQTGMPKRPKSRAAATGMLADAAEHSEALGTAIALHSPGALADGWSWPAILECLPPAKSKMSNV